MFAASLLQYVQLAYLSQPKPERALYRSIRRQKATSIVEIGVGTGRRAIRLVRVAQRYAGHQRVRYTGIDLFEARSQDQPGWTIKLAHRTLSSVGAKVQLVPGDPLMGLSRSANSLLNTDMLVIGGDQDRESLAKAWFYVPRMLHSQSQVFLQESDPDRNGAAAWTVLAAAEIAQLAEQAQEERQRAA